ncbi:MAG: motility associated factor glycosyltransferase family protein [Bacillota bacterium]
MILEEYKNFEDNTAVIFYGTGLGYHIAAFAKRNPNVDFFIYEPVPEVFDQYISHGELSKLPLSRVKSIVLADTEQQAISFFKNFIERINNKLVIIPLPSHKAAFPEQYKQFQELFNKLIKDKRSSLHTNYAFQKRWILNSIKNFKEVISTPNILMEKKGAFTGQPALLVAAGPSLNEEIEKVRYIKDNGLAYIFSVGSAINTLVENNIYPHAACTYDPTENNQKVFAKVVERDIKEIPMIFGSSVGYETLERYSGPKYHMLTSQDTVSAFFLRSRNGEPIQGVYDAPTIAVVTLQLLYQLGFNPIILVGQNLAYKDKKRHSAGVDYSSEVTEQEIKNGLWVKDVYGGEVLTNEGFNRMRLQMEMYIEKLSGIKVINTTRGGADIKGAPFVSMEEAMTQYLKDEITVSDWLPESINSYDNNYLFSQLDAMEDAHAELKKISSQIGQLLKKIRSLAVNRNFDQLEKNVWQT